MRLSVLEPSRQPPGPLGGQVFDDLTLDSACDPIQNWKLIGKTLFKLEDASERWMCFECRDSSDFEASFQSSSESWQKIIGIKFNLEGCCELAKSFFNGDESLLYRYPLDKREASKKLTKEELAKVQAIQERLCTRRWWEFWR
jgi:hypothetical protein